MMSVDDRVAATVGDQPPVDGERRHECDRERHGQRAPEEGRVEPGIHRARHEQDEGVASTISITVIDNVSAANAIPTAAPTARPPRTSGSSVSE